MEFFIEVVFEIWLSKVGQVSRRTHKLLFLSIIAAKLDFFGKGSFNVYVADIQRQIVLKFQIYHINSFENIMVESCRKLSFSMSSCVVVSPGGKMFGSSILLRRHMTNHNGFVHENLQWVISQSHITFCTSMKSVIHFVFAS